MMTKNIYREILIDFIVTVDKNFDRSDKKLSIKDLEDKVIKLHPVVLTLLNQPLISKTVFQNKAVLEND